MIFTIIDDTMYYFYYFDLLCDLEQEQYTLNYHDS
jgi:hypothetical protein